MVVFNLATDGRQSVGSGRDGPPNEKISGNVAAGEATSGAPC